MQNVISGLLLAVLVGGSLLVFWQARRTRAVTDLRFHWRYLGLPLAILVLTVAFTAWLLPGTPRDLAFNFSGGAVPVGYFARGTLLGLVFGLQVAIALPIIFLSWVTLRLRGPVTDVPEVFWKLDRTLSLVTNLAALPQALLCFALADVLSYNVYGAHLMLGWVFGAVVLVLGAAFLGMLFAMLPRRKGKTPAKTEGA